MGVVGGYRSADCCVPASCVGKAALPAAPTDLLLWFQVLLVARLLRLKQVELSVFSLICRAIIPQLLDCCKKCPMRIPNILPP